MFDFDLQLRFWRSVTDAILHGTEATLAAASAWQSEIVTADESATTPLQAGAAPTNPMMWWLTTWQAMMSCRRLRRTAERPEMVIAS